MTAVPIRIVLVEGPLKILFESLISNVDAVSLFCTTLAFFGAGSLLMDILKRPSISSNYNKYLIIKGIGVYSLIFTLSTILIFASDDIAYMMDI